MHPNDKENTMNAEQFKKQLTLHRLDHTQDDQYTTAAAALARYAYGFTDIERTALVAIMERAKLPEGDALMPQTSRKIGALLEEINAIHGDTIKS